MARRKPERRRRGEGSVYPSEGGWVAAFPLGIIGGRRIVKRKRAASQADALDALEGLRKRYGPGTGIADSTVEEYLTDWLARHRRVRESTRASYRNHIDLHIIPLLGAIRVADLRPADVDRLIEESQRRKSKRGKLAPATVLKIVTTLRIALNDGVRRGDLTANVAARVELPRVERAPVRPMTETEADAIVDAMREHWLGPVIRLLMGSGLRLGEALSLNQGDVGEGFVRLRASKTTLRAVPISDDAQAGIREAIAAAPRIGRDEPLFFGPRRNRAGHRDRLQGWTVTHAFPKALEAAGLRRVTPHGLRHGAATILVAKGVHMRVIAAQLGHANPGMTARVYAHVVPESQMEAARLLDRRKAN